MSKSPIVAVLIVAALLAPVTVLLAPWGGSIPDPVQTPEFDIALENDGSPAPTFGNPDLPENKWINRYSHDILHESGTHTTSIYIGPQVFWDDETSTWQEMNFEDHYVTDGYYLIQNAHITARIYDWYSVFYDPDDQRVSVDDERWIVEVYNEKTEKWREVDLYTPSLSYSDNGTHLTVTRTFDSPEGLFEVSYIVRQGSRLKHDVVFKSRMEGSNQFRATMKLTGIHSDKVRHSEGEETITAEKHVVSPHFFIGENNSNLVLSEYLWSLGVTNDETGEWTPTTLKDVIFNTHAKGMKADIIIGNYNLDENESLEIDPDSDTFYVGGSADDAHEYGEGTFGSTAITVLIKSHTDPTGTSYLCGGFRFPSVTIPNGSTISTAKFSGYVYSTTYDDINCEIYGNDVDNALDFSDNPHIIPTDDRPRTTASVSWVANALGVDWHDKTGLEGIVEEIVGRGGWGSGNALVLLFIANVASSKQCKFFSYDKEPQYAAKLEVTWTPPAVPPGKPVLVSPENQHSTSDNTPTFAWENGSDATSHRLVIDNSQNFDDGENIYDNASAWDNSGTAIENELPADNYWWRVCAVNAQGENWSENTWTFGVVAGAWGLVETWTGTVEAPVEWQLVETWTGTVEALAQWRLVESWSGTTIAFAEWNLAETWSGTVEAPVEWGLIEEWSGAVQAPSAWILIESWSGTVRTPAEWNLIETWTGTVEAPAEWYLIETWTGDVNAPVAWVLIETWSGSVLAYAEWSEVESWSGTIYAVGWTLIETWSGTIQTETIAAWHLIETWDSTIRTVAMFALSVSVTPENQSGIFGNTLIYTVIVFNIGEQTDNYDLTSSDPQGWAPYFDNTTFSNVASGENRTTDLNVELWAIEMHTVTVTATSQGDSSVSDSASVTAISAAGYPGIPIGGADVALVMGLLAVGIAICMPFVVVLAMRRRREEGA